MGANFAADLAHAKAPALRKFKRRRTSDQSVEPALQLRPDRSDQAEHRTDRVRRLPLASRGSVDGDGQPDQERSDLQLATVFFTHTFAPQYAISSGFAPKRDLSLIHI